MLIEDGYARLASLRSLGDRASIIASIRESSRDFERANILFMPFRIIPSDQIRLGAIAIDGGLSLSRALKALVESLPDTRTSTTAMVEYSVEDTTTPTYRAKARDISPLVPLGIDIPTDWLEKNSTTLSYLESSLTDAAQAFARVEKLDDPRKESILHVSRAFSELARILDFYQSHHSDILTMLGHTDPQRYIVFDQNRDEIRANGGFPGSVITFTLYKGNILDYRTDDIYYYDWNLYPYKELPPPGIALISGNYGLRDVNYYPDFRETLERANSFVERSGDATLTTGIAIHQGIIEDILKSVWPVTLSGIAIPFTADNFSPLMSTLVEARHGEINTPKDILFRFIGSLLEKIWEKRAYDTVLSSLEDALKNGEILFASRDRGVDDFLTNYRPQLPWQCEWIMNNEQWIMNNEKWTASSEQRWTQSGKIENLRTCSRNWAYPLLTSVSGNKSDRFMSRLYEARTSVIGACRYENKITLTHTDNYIKTDTENVEKYMDLIGLHDAKAREKMLFIQWNGKNRIYMRLYVPKGSTLTGSTVWVDIIDKPEATVFTWLLETPVGASTSKTIRYVTDVPGCSEGDAYLTWYRQPGLQHTTMKSK